MALLTSTRQRRRNLKFVEIEQMERMVLMDQTEQIESNFDLVERD
jgi:hypothetical protein